MEKWSISITYKNKLQFSFEHETEKPGEALTRAVTEMETAGMPAKEIARILIHAKPRKG